MCHCFPTQSQFEVNQNEHLEEQGNHNHHFDGCSHQGESRQHQHGGDRQENNRREDNQREKSNLEHNIRENAHKGENLWKMVENEKGQPSFALQNEVSKALADLAM